MTGKAPVREGVEDELHREPISKDHAVVEVDINEKCNPSEEAQYIRTRHNNLRCFPVCSVPHNQNSFCGQPITGKIKCSAESGLSVIGSFRSTDKAPFLKLGETWNQATQFKDAWIIGSCIPAGSGYWRFTFAPSRKWQYTSDDRISKSELHVFTIYVLKDSACVAIKDSNEFHVIPIWTAEREKESLRRTRARQKLRDQPAQATLPSASMESSPVSPPPYATSSFVSESNIAFPVPKLLHTNGANGNIVQMNHPMEMPVVGYPAPRTIVQPQNMILPSVMAPNTFHQTQYPSLSPGQAILPVQEPQYMSYGPAQPFLLSIDQALSPPLMQPFNNNGGHNYLSTRAPRHQGPFPNERQN